MRYEANVEFTVYTTSKAIESKGCNTILFENKGDVTCRINNNYRLRPNEVLEINHVQNNVVDRTQYNCRFDLSDPETKGTSQELVVITTFLSEVITTAQPVQSWQKL